MLKVKLNILPFVSAFHYFKHVTIGETENVYFMEWAERHLLFTLSLQCELRTDNLKVWMLKFLSPVKGSYSEWKYDGNWRGIHQIQFH